MRSEAIVSIIVPTRNRHAFLQETLASIRAQTCEQWEAIVVDDGSTDDTRRVMALLAMEEPRIQYVERVGEPSGGSACRNIGLSLSRGECVIFLDSDDCLAPWCIDQRVEVMRRHPELDFAVFPTRLFKREWDDMPLMWNRLEDGDDLDRLLCIDPPWGTEGAIWRREALQRLDGPWDPQTASWQDIEFHIRAVAAGLKYRKFRTVDAFHRMRVNERETVTANATTRRHMESRCAMFGRVRRFLEREGLLTAERRPLIAGLYFHHAETALRELGQAEALRYWRVCPWRGLISRGAYVAIRSYFGWAHAPKVRWRLRRLLVHRWPWLDRVGRSTTHFKAPAEELPPMEQKMEERALKLGAER